MEFPKERIYANPEDATMTHTTNQNSKPFNELHIIKSKIVKNDRLYKAQLEMAKKTQV